MKEDFVRIREELNRIGIRRVSADFYLEPKRRGSVFFVKSPATNDSEWSLALYPNENSFHDFANGGYSGDCIAFLAYIKNLNQWQALKELQSYYGLSDSREHGKQEVRRRIQLQQEKEQKRAKRRQAFKTALFSEIDHLRMWEDAYKLVMEKRLFEPFSAGWMNCISELQKTKYRLDILCAADQYSYRFMKMGSEYASDHPAWLSDTLDILEEEQMFFATKDEREAIERQMAHEMRKGRCDV